MNSNTTVEKSGEERYMESGFGKWIEEERVGGKKKVEFVKISPAKEETNNDLGNGAN